MPRAGYGELTAGAETSATQALHPPGSEAAPGSSFTTDPNTGIYLNADDTLGLVVNATDQVLVTDGGFQFQKATTVSTSTGTLSITSPTISSPTIGATSWASATHTHAGSSTGGTVALSSTTGTLAISAGGTASTSASAARTALGVAIGSDVQAYDADLAALAGLANTDSNFIVGNGSAWVAEGASTARTSLGLGSLATASTVNNDNWSGTDLAVTNGGTGASSLNNLITLGTHTTGNYAATVADATNGGVTIANSGAESAAITVALNLNDLSAAAVNVANDSIAIVDADASNGTRIESIADLATAMAGTNVTASSGQFTVAAAAAQTNAYAFFIR